MKTISLISVICFLIAGALNFMFYRSSKLKMELWMGIADVVLAVAVLLEAINQH
jgi:hypothetical protein